MMRLHFSLKAALTSVLVCLATACHADEAVPSGETMDLPELGLMGTIPIYWGESGDVGELLAGSSAAHWARALLEADYQLRPLDTLNDESLAGLDFLMLAQPRALSAAENVALDAWVRGGGRLLLFADPMLTGESRFAIGDRRRPQDVILLSPILGHWGLVLEFDEDRAGGFALVPTPDAPLPVNLPGSLTVRDGEADCKLRAADVLAECAVGKGRAVIFADAALLDLHETHPGAATALNWLIATSFGTPGDSAGNPSPVSFQLNEISDLEGESGAVDGHVQF
jgi:hypothetical protein